MGSKNTLSTHISKALNKCRDGREGEAFTADTEYSLPELIFAWFNVPFPFKVFKRLNISLQVGEHRVNDDEPTLAGRVQRHIYRESR